MKTDYEQVIKSLIATCGCVYSAQNAEKAMRELMAQVEELKSHNEVLRAYILTIKGTDSRYGEQMKEIAQGAFEEFAARADFRVGGVA